MYTEWPLLTLAEFDRTVLDVFSRDAGRLVTGALIRELAQSQNVDASTSTVDNRKCLLKSDEDVNWILQVIDSLFKMRIMK